MTAEELYCRLKKQILSGELEAGTRLAEVVLAERFQVSRLYVKSALQTLREEKLVEHIRNRGYFVLQVPDSFFEEIDDIRQALEGVIVKRVIQVGTDQELSGLARILDRVELFIRGGMIQDGLEEVGRFYQTMYQISRYERVVAILKTYSESIAALRARSAATQEEHLRSLESTRALFNAIRERDTARALQYMEERRQDVMPPV